jgi:hypothetical protein
MNNRPTETRSAGMINLKQIWIVKVQTWKNSAYRIFAVKKTIPLTYFPSLLHSIIYQTVLL